MAHLLDRCGTLRPTDRPRPMIAWRAPQVGWFIFPIIAALFGLPTAMPIERRHPAAAERPRPIIAWRAPQVERFIFPIVAAPFGRPTAMSIERRHPSAAERPRPIYSVACSSGRVVHFPYRCDTPRPADRDFHSAGGVLRHADARGGFRPANAARTPPHFFPTCDVQEANLFI